MTRIPYLRREELGPEGQQLWDGIVSGQGDRLLTAEGGLVGELRVGAAALFSFAVNQGQLCTAGTRLLVEARALRRSLLRFRKPETDEIRNQPALLLVFHVHQEHYVTELGWRGRAGAAG